jgi:hypothetical protein
MNILITEHADFEMQRRQIPLSLVQRVVQEPQQVVPSRKGRLIYQSRFFDEQEDKEMSLRVVLDIEGDDFWVVTVYKTSRIEKYWEEL